MKQNIDNKSPNSRLKSRECGDILFKFSLYFCSEKSKDKYYETVYWKCSMPWMW